MRLGTMAAAAALAMAATSAAAAPVFSTTIDIGVTQDSVDSSVVNSTTGGPQSFAGSFGASSYLAEAGPGLLKVKGTTTGPVNNNVVSTQIINRVGVKASFTDEITINAPGLSSGSFVATILIDGALSSAAAGGPLSPVVAFSNSSTLVEVAGLADPVFSLTVNTSN